jgi:hypothetical protein
MGLLMNQTDFICPLEYHNHAFDFSDIPNPPQTTRLLLISSSQLIKITSGLEHDYVFKKITLFIHHWHPF